MSEIRNLNDDDTPRQYHTAYRIGFVFSVERKKHAEVTIIGYDIKETVCIANKMCGADMGCRHDLLALCVFAFFFSLFLRGCRFVSSCFCCGGNACSELVYLD